MKEVHGNRLRGFIKIGEQKDKCCKAALGSVCLAALSFRDFLNINAGKMEMCHYKYEQI